MLNERMQDTLGELGYRAVSISHHPTADRFEGPQNKRRHDFWQWAMQAMVTYGPDVNVSLPAELSDRLDFADLHAKVNYYAPAHDGSPWLRRSIWAGFGISGGEWANRSEPTAGASSPQRSSSTRRRRVGWNTRRLKPATGWRISTPSSCSGSNSCWTTACAGRASDQTRIYDLGAVARDGLAAETVADRAAEVLGRAPEVLAARGFHPGPLKPFRRRLETGRLPADDLIDLYEREHSIPAVLRHLATLIPVEVAEPIGLVTS